MHVRIPKVPGMRLGKGLFALHLQALVKIDKTILSKPWLRGNFSNFLSGLSHSAVDPDLTIQTWLLLIMHPPSLPPALLLLCSFKTRRKKRANIEDTLALSPKSRTVTRHTLRKFAENEYEVQLLRAPCVDSSPCLGVCARATQLALEQHLFYCALTMPKGTRPAASNAPP